MALLFVAVSGCSGEEPVAAAADPKPSTNASTPKQVTDSPLDEYRRDLLKLAFRAASSFPSNPHHKNRGTAQQRVVDAAFDLEQPKLALGWSSRVEGWRRGLAYADYAWVSAQHGQLRDCDNYIELAQKVIDELRADPNAQQWRADKVKLKIARALQTAGKVDKAHEVAGELDAGSTGAVDQSWTETIVTGVAAMADDRARQEVSRIADTFSQQPFGEQFTSLMVLGSLHGRFFADAEMRARIEELVCERFVKLPTVPRLDAMTAMVESYLAAGDNAGGREIVRRMEELIGERQWQERHRIPQMARIVELDAKLGDLDRARAGLSQVLRRYHEKRNSMIDIDRAAALRPVAFAAIALGDREQGDALLMNTIEEGVENPNSRPRCNDLVATCVAMARRGVKPSEDLWNRMREIADGLGDPW